MSQVDDQEKTVIEVDGPPMAYFEIPLDWSQGFADEFKLDNKLTRLRMSQRIVYQNFRIQRESEAKCQEVAALIVSTVKQALIAETGIAYGIIWWRRRPHFTEDGDIGNQVHLRLGTSPSLPAKFWDKLSRQVDNCVSDMR